MKFKKIGSILLASAMVCSLFAGCSKQEAKKDESKNTDETKLSLWTVFTGYCDPGGGRKAAKRNYQRL